VSELQPVHGEIRTHKLQKARVDSVKTIADAVLSQPAKAPKFRQHRPYPNQPEARAPIAIHLGQSHAKQYLLGERVVALTYTD
jgi:hypothetical protein